LSLASLKKSLSLMLRENKLEWFPLASLKTFFEAKATAKNLERFSFASF
jgi:hypothetical protein